MLKSFSILVTVCLVASICTATNVPQQQQQQQQQIKNVNDREVKQTICSKPTTTTQTTTDARETLGKLQQCIKQKRIEKLNTRIARSTQDETTTTSPSTNGITNVVDMIQKTFDMNKLIQTFKTLSQQQQQKQTTKNKLNVVLTLTEVDDQDEQQTQQQGATLRCEQDQQIKIITASLSSQNYEQQCQQQQQQQNQITNEWLNELKESCDETKKTTTKMIAMCEGQQQCQVNVEKNFTSVCDCTQNKYLDVTYTCLNKQQQQQQQQPQEKSTKKVKRALHYRVRQPEIEREREFRRRIARAEGLEYLLDNINEVGIYGYGGYGYGGYGYGYGGYGGGLYGGYGGIGGIGGIGGYGGIGGIGAYGK